MDSWQENHWTSHWMAVQINLRSDTTLVVIVYAPSEKDERLQGYDEPILIGGDFNCTLTPRLDDSIALRRLLGRAQLSDVLDDDIEQAEDEQAIAHFHATAHTLFLHIVRRWIGQLPSRSLDWGAASCSARPQATARKSGSWILTSGLISKITATIELAQRQVDDTASVPTSDCLTARRLADWGDTWKIRLRKILLATTKQARQGLTKRYRQRLRRLYIRLGPALLDARSSEASQVRSQTQRRDHSSLIDTSVDLRKKVSECRRLWQRTKKERLLLQYTYSPGETSRRVYTRVSTRFQDNTIVFLGSKAQLGSNRSQELADEMADGWGQIMTHSFARFEETAAFLDRAAPPAQVDDFSVTSSISTEDVSAALKRLRRGKAAGPDELNDTFYRDYAAELAPISAALYTRWLECSVLLASFEETNTQCLKKTAASALPLDHRLIVFLNSDYKLFTQILSF
ncbi:uncharacterized protein CCR75_003321 [Bremia lactucae]|uniref:Uncharacterized protein n=1 Tax=Bremia lactucae TaxID=4779 RepID=A0A976ILG3_BRELC|nr:hypothetical protein CCR75_003321 [Bremia lactucae]